MALHATDTRPSRLRSRLVGVLTGTLALIGTLVGVPAAGASLEEAADSTTIWGEDAPPTAVHEFDASAVAVGTVFTPAEDGLVRALRYYKTTGSDAPVTGALWTDAGDRLASAVFDPTEEQGWQTVALEEPVPLQAGERYVVSYRVPPGVGFTVTRHFSGDAASDEIEVPSRSAGVYTYEGRDTVPGESWRSSQYWADVVFEPASAAPTPAPTPGPEPAPAPDPAPAPEDPPVLAFPTAATTGVPDGWTPQREITGDHTISTEGAVIEDVRFTGGVVTVRAANVTLRRVELVSARIVNEYAGTCYGGLRIEDTTISRGAQDVYQPVIQSGGYTATRVELDGVSEGFRVAGADVGCGPVTIEDSYAKIDPAQGCDLPGVDWHGDGLQGYLGVALTLRNTTIAMGRTPYCLGTSAFFYPDQYNTRVDVENVLLSGGGYVFRLETPGSVSGLKIVEDSWEWGPIDVTSCDRVTWGEGNEVVRVASDGSLTSVSPLRCTG